MTSKNITALSTAEAHQLINIAVEELQHLARQEGSRGILVTRTGPGQFIVELSENVPYGLTLEAVA
ncbi:hypothetical protein [Arthrobacter crystallopoietes]|uniref:Uncharacterized protein n=1 Tax=Crystallibacter crystallopoietes TaxID=37928 RepID=A0A1H1HX09_9MICC|nr:hypothetical protein [Arthrobacter crystallopoietes]SDR29997.1 hypothetical protein SAMN04489742_4754 [Arthrobacter crystallopoietes]